MGYFELFIALLFLSMIITLKMFANRTKKRYRNITRKEQKELTKRRSG